MQCDNFINLVVINEILWEEEDELIKSGNKRKRIWTKDWLQKRRSFSHVRLLDELEVSAPGHFQNFLRMSNEVYKSLLAMVEPYILKQNTFMRDAITPNERLSATIRFLASGNSMEDLKFLTAISAQSLGKIIIETCTAITHVLKDYIKVRQKVVSNLLLNFNLLFQMPKTEEEWEAVSKGFEDSWNFPNCIGAIDGKHVTIRKPPGSGSFYYNYKKSFSIVLLALVDSNYEFLFVEAGANGRVSDGGVFANSKFADKFTEKKLRIPEWRQLPNSTSSAPYVIVADDAFPLKENIMKPYGGNQIESDRRIFNYRLSRARRIVENAFGILSSRFRILLTTMNLSPEKASKITITCCYLHNFLKRNNSSNYLSGSVDVENVTSGETRGGSWRADALHLLAAERTSTRNPSELAKKVRDNFCAYFNNEGSVPWQQEFI